MTKFTDLNLNPKVLKAIEEALIDPQGKEVFVDMELRQGALRSLNRMLDFTAAMTR